ncbi:MAG: sigma-70 family RNA polymerase sigma factor [Gemmataceae bacterium]
MTVALADAPDASELELLARLQAGEPAAFEAVVARFGGRLLAAARRLCPNEEDARDVVQDGFLSAFKALGQFDGRARFSTWLHRIVINAALQKLRAQTRRPTRSIEDWLPTFQPDGHQTRDSEAWPSGDFVLEKQETREAVRRAIAELPDAYRTVLVLRDIEELDTEETARTLELPTGVVKTRLHRARQALRTLLEPHFRRGAL